jgi:hypothetical protein
MENVVSLPAETVDLHTELVPAVRALLGRGLSDSFMRTCVRIGAFEIFSGGLKADLVGGLTLQVNAAIKLGGAELEAHAALMNAVNMQRPATFAEVLDVVRLDETRWLLLMAQLRKHETLLDLVYERDTSFTDLARALDKCFAGLAAVHAIPRSTTAPDRPNFPAMTDPYTARIRSKLIAAVNAESGMGMLLEKPGRVLGRNCPPLGHLLERLETWLEYVMPRAPQVLVHGDPHLRNIMVRRYGKGLGMRFIDPNPEHGFTDPTYDFGKLLHFAEPVGWALAKPEVCRASLSADEAGWTLEAGLRDAPGAARRRQALVERELNERIARSSWARDPTWPARLQVAKASAHLGLLTRFADPAVREARLFVLAHALAALAAWNDLLTSA